MRHSLSELAEKTKIFCADKEGKDLNNAIEGYPLIHHVMIERRDEPKLQRLPAYLMLIKTILKHPCCDPNIVDKHGYPPLYYTVIPTEQNKLITTTQQLALIELFIQAGGEPNRIVGRTNFTLLEFAIHHCASRPIIDYLFKKTKITLDLRQRCQHFYEEAVENSESDPHISAYQINILMQYELAHKSTAKEVNTLLSHPDFAAGCWIRIVSSPEEEKNIFDKRANLSDEVLYKQRHQSPFDLSKKNVHYTPYSPATFVKSSFPVSLFNSIEGSGVILRAVTKRPIAYWYDGHTEELTWDMTFSSRVQLDNGQQTGQYWEVCPEQIARAIEERYENKYLNLLEYRKENPADFDDYDILFQKNVDEIAFSWNEGLLRYNRKDIIGIYVNPDNKQSALSALKLREILKVKVNLYHYDVSGSFYRVRAEDLRKQYESTGKKDITVESQLNASKIRFLDPVNHISINQPSQGKRLTF